MFKHLIGAKEARKLLIDLCAPVRRTESLPIAECIDRVVSKDIVSPVDLPSFNRAAMDGFSVRSKDTRGASSSAPVYLQDFVPIRTGMAVPKGFDAVVMIEDSVLRGSTLEIAAEVHPHRNVSCIGEDIHSEDIVFKEGHRLRPPDISLLASLGLREIMIYARPKIAIIPTGSELVPIAARSLEPGEAYETNGLMAELYVEKWGCKALKSDIVPDDPLKIHQAMDSARDADMIIIIGGTSIGEKDYAPNVLAEAGELLIHGVRVQPGKPTAFGTVRGTPVVCLPGYPVAALSDLYLFVRPALKKMAHLNDSLPKITVRLARKIASRPGYVSVVRVALKDGEAEPIMVSGAGIMSSVAKADGFVIIPEEREGVEAGEMVEFRPFE